MTRKLQLIQDQFEQSENAHQQTKSEIFIFNNIHIQLVYLRVKYSSNLRLKHNQIKNIRAEYLLLQDSYSKTIQNWKIYLHTLQKGN